MDMLNFLREQGVSARTVDEIRRFREYYHVNEDMAGRVPEPAYRYYGPEVWEMAAAALISGENLLLVGPKATGKNVLAEGLAAAFGRPEWNVSFYVNTDAGALIGADTFADGRVTLRKGPILLCAENGGFGVLDEINMAKNESLAVLHAVLDFRRMIDVPGYGLVRLDEATRFIGTMNYGYAGTRELNEALASRFMIISMPVISSENLERLMKDRFPALSGEYRTQFAQFFGELRKKCEGGEISAKALDLRGLLAAVQLMYNGLPVRMALDLGIVNKCFDPYERQLVKDIVDVRFPEDTDRDEIFK